MTKKYQTQKMASEETTSTHQKPRSRGAALIKTNAQVRSEMARIYRSFNAGDMTMEEMNKRIAVLDKIRLTWAEPTMPKKNENKDKEEKLTIREKLILNRIKRGLDKRIYHLLQEFVKVHVANANRT